MICKKGDIVLVKYDKCFTINSELVDKKLASVNDALMENMQKFLTLLALP